MEKLNANYAMTDETLPSRNGFTPSYKFVTVKQLALYLGCSYGTAIRRMNLMRDALDKNRLLSGKSGKVKKLYKNITWAEAYDYLG